ncbi:MAG: ATP-binding protein [Nitrospirota bacterium]
MQLNITHKILIGNVVIILVAVTISLYAIYNFYILNKITQSMLSGEIPSIKTATDMRNIFKSQVRYERQFWILREKDFVKLFDESDKNFNKLMGELDEQTKNNNTGFMILNDISDLHRLYSDIFHASIRKYLSDTETIQTYINKGEDESLRLSEEIIRHIQKLIDSNQITLREKTIQSNYIVGNANQIEIIMIIIVLLLNVVFVYILVKTINTPLKRLKKATEALSEGHFDYKIKPSSSNDEIGLLIDSFNKMSIKLKELDQLKEDFVSYISHELRNPLTSLNTAANLLGEETFGEINKRERVLINVIEDDCKRLLSLINDLLDLSKLKAGMMPFYMESCSINSIIKNSVKEMSVLALKKNIKIDVSLLENDTIMFGDRNRIRQVVVNILSNSIKFTHSGGKIQITTEMLLSENQIKISISDTGVGISQESLDKVFDKFYQLTIHGQEYRGSGLGLAITKQIIDGHKGNIWAESTSGEGSRFIFTLPLIKDTEVKKKIGLRKEYEVV